MISAGSAPCPRRCWPWLPVPRPAAPQYLTLLPPDPAPAAAQMGLPWGCGRPSLTGHVSGFLTSLVTLHLLQLGSGRILQGCWGFSPLCMHMCCHRAGERLQGRGTRAHSSVPAGFHFLFGSFTQYGRCLDCHFWLFFTCPNAAERAPTPSTPLSPARGRYPDRESFPLMTRAVDPEACLSSFKNSSSMSSSWLHAGLLLPEGKWSAHFFLLCDGQSQEWGWFFACTTLGKGWQHDAQH